MRVLHIGDLHFWHFSANPLHYWGKRMLGFGNLAVRRARSFRLHLAPLLVQRINSLEPDWILFSGDFTTTSLSREFTTAKQVLDPLVRNFPDRIRAVPGNHDRYTLLDIRQRTFESHLDSFVHRKAWPYFVKLDRGLWMIGIDATTSNGLGSHGRVTRRSIAAIRHWWNQCRNRGARVDEIWVLCHFPAEDPPHEHSGDRGEQLVNADALLDLLGELGVPVFYLHGHHHYRWIYGSPTVPNLTYLNAGAPLLRRRSLGLEADLGFLELLRIGGETRVQVHTCDIQSERWRSPATELPPAGEFIDLQGTIARG